MTLFKKLLLFITLPLYALDQWSKWWVVGHFSEPPAPVVGLPKFTGTMDAPYAVIEGWFNFTRVHNQGVAFGLGNGSDWAPVVFLCVPIIAMVGLRIFWKKGVFSNLLSKIAVALLLCGIFGNLTDRLLQGSHLSYMAGKPFWERLSAGYVVDFLSVKLPYYEKISPESGGWWPVFNVADSCICVAAVLLFLGGLREEKQKKAAAA